MRAMLIQAAIAAAVSGCAASVEPARAQVAPTGPIEPIDVEPFGVPGEEMVFDARFRGVLVARVTVAVGEPGTLEGRHQIVVASRIESDGLLAIVREAYYQLTTWVDLAEGYPTRSLSEFAGTVKGKRRTGGRDKTWRPANRVHNAISAVGALRNWDPPDGTRGTAQIWIGRRYTVRLTTTRREVRDGTPAVRYDGLVVWRKPLAFVAWISDDRRRVPLRIEFQTKWGVAELDLIDYSDES